MQEQNSLDGDWMNAVTEKTATLKVLDGDVIPITFQNNGIKKDSVDYGSSIAFLVRVDNELEDKTFYVKSNNFDLLGQIKEIAKSNNGTIKGLRCQISRIGSKKSDTRYKIKKI